MALGLGERRERGSAGGNEGRAPQRTEHHRAHQAERMEARIAGPDFAALLRALDRPRQRADRFGGDFVVPDSRHHRTCSDVIARHPNRQPHDAGRCRNDRDGVLVLSRGAGSYSELSAGALAIEPEDTEATAAALYQALTMSEDERSARARRLRTAILSHQSHDWLARLEQDIGEGYSAETGAGLLAKSALTEGV